MLGDRWASAAITIYLSLNARLPMQAVLQVYYVVISVYGWWHWTREEEARGSLVVSTLPIDWHIVAAVVVVLVSALTAHWLASNSCRMAIPRLAHDLGQSLCDVVGGSRQARELALLARHRFSDWHFCSRAQGLYLLALLSVVYLGVSAVGFMRWLKTYRDPIPVSYATRSAGLSLGYVPGYRPGDRSV